MCLTPRIIVNPKYMQRTHDFPLVHLANTCPDFFYTYDWPYSFNHSRFYYRRNYVTHKNIKDYYAYNMLGETIPVYMECPCGHCQECIKQKESQIIRRCYLEDAASDYRTLFLTLTYDDVHLPCDGVNIPDIQKFFKRLRIRLKREFNYDIPLRYCLFSEYGSQHGRPHYHCLIFNFNTGIFPKFLDFCDFIRDTWQNGFILVKHLLDSKGIGYVTKYLLKDKFTPRYKNPNFWLASRSGGGLGSPILRHPSIISALKDPQLRITVKVCGDVKTFYLPKYIYDKLFPLASSLYPPKIFSAVKSLCYNLCLLHTVADPDYYSIYLDKHPYIFPPKLVDRYRPVFHRFMSTFKMSDSYLLPHIRGSFDIPAISHTIDILISELDSFVLDVSRILSADAEREIRLTPHFKRCLKYIESLPPVEDREILLSEEKHKISSRFVDSQ